MRYLILFTILMLGCEIETPQDRWDDDSSDDDMYGDDDTALPARSPDASGHRGIEVIPDEVLDLGTITTCDTYFVDTHIINHGPFPRTVHLNFDELHFTGEFFMEAPGYYPEIDLEVDEVYTWRVGILEGHTEPGIVEAYYYLHWSEYVETVLVTVEVVNGEPC